MCTYFTLSFPACPRLHPDYILHSFVAGTNSYAVSVGANMSVRVHVAVCSGVCSDVSPAAGVTRLKQIDLA